MLYGSLELFLKNHFYCFKYNILCFHIFSKKLELQIRATKSLEITQKIT